MIRYYPNGYVNNADPFSPIAKPGFYLMRNPRNPELCVVYNTKAETYGDASLNAFYSPTMQRWLKGGLTGYGVPQHLVVATMETQDEATMIGDGCSGLRLGTEEFKMKMFLLAGEVIEKEEPPPPAPPSNYLDELADEYDVDPTDWNEISRKPCPFGGDFVHLKCDDAEVEIFAQVSNDMLGEYRQVGELTFDVQEFDDPNFSSRADGKMIVAMFAFGGEDQDLECEWVLEHHYGLDMTYLEEVSDGQFAITTDDDLETAKAKITAMGGKLVA